MSAAERIHFVGNVMIDSLARHAARAVAPAETLAAAGCDPALADDASGYALVTLHRPSNVDERDALAHVLDILAEIARRLPRRLAHAPAHAGDARALRPRTGA